MNPDIAQHASQGGKAKARAKLTLERVEAELPALDSAGNAKRALDLVLRWAACNLLSSGTAGACVKAIDTWLRADALEVDRTHLGELEAQVKRLEIELAETRRTADVV